jgi:hypothetical protein
LLVHPNQGVMGGVGSAEDVGGWIEDRFDWASLEVSGAFAYFSAVKPGSQ